MFRRVGAVVDKGFFIICATLGTLLLALGGAFAGSFNLGERWESISGLSAGATLTAFNPYTALAAGAILLTIGALGTYRDQNRQQDELRQLRKDSDRMDTLRVSLNYAQEELQESLSRTHQLHVELVTTWLKGASKTLELTSRDRVTVYYEFDEEFYLLARYSKNPEFGKVHRQKFPLNKGVISMAWQHEFQIERDCPDPNDEYDAYKTYVANKYGYEPEKIDSLTMKSCRYAGYAIVDADEHIGVVVFESENPDFFQNDIEPRIGDYCKEYQGQLSKFVRDGLSLDKEISIKREGKNKSVEADILGAIPPGGV